MPVYEKVKNLLTILYIRYKSNQPVAVAIKPSKSSKKGGTIALE